MFRLTFAKIKIFIKRLLVKLLEFELLFYRKNNSGKKKLLLIRIDAIGDFVIFSPMLKYYRQIYPDYEITLLVNKINEGLANLFVDNFDTIILIDKEKANNNIIYRRRLMIRLKKEGFNTAIYPAYSREQLGDYLIKISDARERIGFNGDLCNISKKQKRQNNYNYTKLIKATPGIISEPQRNREFVESLGNIRVNDYIPILTPAEDDETKADDLLEKAGLKDKKFIVIFPGASLPGKLWTIKKYSELINWIKTKYSFEVVICGSKNQKYLYDGIQEHVKFQTIDMTGETTLPVLAAIIQKSSVYIGNDTSAVHLSSAVGTPTICIMGGGHFGRFFPYGDLSKNKIVYDHNMKCKNDNWKCAKGLPKEQPAPCIANIQLDDVKREVEKMLENNYNE